MSETIDSAQLTTRGPVASVGACACTGNECACEQSRAAVSSEMPLTSLQPGQVGLVTRTTLAEQDAALLRAMGVRPNARVHLCQAGEPWIIEVRRTGGACSRIGLARAIASNVFVGPA